MIFWITLLYALTLANLLLNITGKSLMADALTYLIESVTGYRTPQLLHGICDTNEQDDLAQHLAPYFTAISSLRLFYDPIGWQILVFDVVLPNTGISSKIRKALAIETYNYIKTTHGFMNRDILVPALNGTTLYICIATSRKAHEAAQAQRIPKEPPINPSGIEEKITTNNQEN